MTACLSREAAQYSVEHRKAHLSCLISPNVDEKGMFSYLTAAHCECFHGSSSASALVAWAAIFPHSHHAALGKNVHHASCIDHSQTCSWPRLLPWVFYQTLPSGCPLSRTSPPFSLTFLFSDFHSLEALAIHSLCPLWGSHSFLSVQPSQQVLSMLALESLSWLSFNLSPATVSLGKALPQVSFSAVAMHWSKYLQDCVTLCFL